jgi:hypothetical protein
VTFGGAVAEIVKASRSDALDPRFVSAPEAITFDSAGQAVHAFYYPPTNPGFSAPAGTSPPLLVTGPSRRSKERIDEISAFGLSASLPAGRANRIRCRKINRGVLMTRFAVVAFAAALTFSTAANAACNQADLAGLWQIYSAGWDSTGSWWSRCRVRINNGGTMSNGRCSNSLGLSGPITNGSATLVSVAACTFKTQSRFDGDLHKIVHGTLSNDKTTGSGDGTLPGGNFIFTMSKR